MDPEIFFPLEARRSFAPCMNVGSQIDAHVGSCFIHMKTTPDTYFHHQGIILLSGKLVMGYGLFSQIPEYFARMLISN
jgi:hypothetical protein